MRIINLLESGTNVNIIPESIDIKSCRPFVCLSVASLFCRPAGPIMAKFGMHICELIWEWFERQKNFFVYGPEGWVHWGHSPKRYLASR